MLFDSHVHTAVSPDSEMLPAEAARLLKQKNIGCVFTEHADYNPSGELYFSVDFDVYPSQYLQYRNSCVKLGLEITLLTENVQLNQALIAKHNWDFILGSIHWVDCWDLYFDDAYNQLGEKVYSRYLQYAAQMAQIHDFDALAHIDYISRYSRLPEKNVLYAKYAADYDNLLIALLDRGKLLEFNTERLTKNEPATERNLFEIYSRYKQLGGKYVTIGSDAHESTKIGKNFDKALKMLTKIELVPVYFDERRKIKCTKI
ncbi:MAG: PHP domain-containing protein [Defluviitaleaceae bacterium]|nr:PHP domain-containing protein [Defluviitaleaceae bacterium]